MRLTKDDVTRRSNRRGLCDADHAAVAARLDREPGHADSNHWLPLHWLHKHAPRAVYDAYLDWADTVAPRAADRETER